MTESGRDGNFKHGCGELAVSVNPPDKLVKKTKTNKTLLVKDRDRGVCEGRKRESG